VFGARFDENWDVVHGYADTMDGVAAFRGCKYLQSRIGESFKDVERFLKTGREVLFSGTPCQVAGLRRFLKKDYANLLLVDFVCHGVPSPGVFRQYLKEEKQQFARKGGKFSFALPSKPFLSERHSLAGEGVNVEAVSFRDKRLGWKKYSFALSLSKATAAGEKNTVSLSTYFGDNIFMKVFLANMIFRPSCHNCPAKCGRSGNDITLGDFWGIENYLPNFDDDRGTSLVLVYSSKGCNVLSYLRMDSCKVVYDDAIVSNYSVEHSVGVPSCRPIFGNVLWNSNLCCAVYVLLLQRISNRLRRSLKRRK